MTLNNKDFQNIYKLYFKEVLYYVSRHIGDVDKSKDIVQDVFEALWKKRDDLTDSMVKPFLFSISKNKIVDFYRHLEIERKYEFLIRQTLDEASEEENLLEVAQLEEKIKEIISTLPDNTKEIFLLNRESNLKYEEVAKKLNISPKTVAKHISLALSVLRKNIKNFQ